MSKDKVVQKSNSILKARYAMVIVVEIEHTYTCVCNATVSIV